MWRSFSSQYQVRGHLQPNRRGHFAARLLVAAWRRASCSADTAELETVDTAVLKPSLYKDEAALAWPEIVRSSLKALTQQYACFTLCKDVACAQDCGRFHPAFEEPVERVFLDVWSCLYGKLAGGRALPDLANVFSCFARVPASAVAHLNKSSVPRLYWEPRSATGSGGLALRFHAPCCAARPTNLWQGCCLGQTRAKYGLRVREGDEREVFTGTRVCESPCEPSLQDLGFASRHAEENHPAAAAGLSVGGYRLSHCSL